MVKLPKHPLYLSNYHFGPSRGPLCNLPAKNSQSALSTKEVAVWHKWRPWGCKWRPHQVWESSPCRHGDLEMPNGDLGAKWGEMGVIWSGRIPTNWEVGSGPTGQPVGWPYFWAQYRPEIGPGRVVSGRRGFGEKGAMAARGFEEEDE